jgi:hypothetical protein
MLKHPFITFILVVGSLIGGLLWFIQSAQFAWVLKTLAYRYIPKDIGIEGDFSELAIQLFPPGFSVKNPRVKLKEHNIAKMPPGSSVEAERINFTFRLFQIISGDIRVHEVLVQNGNIHLILDPPGKKAKPSASTSPAQKSKKFVFHWDELFQIRAESIGMENVQVNIELPDLKQSFAGKAEKLKFSQWQGKGGLGYLAQLDLNHIHAVGLIPGGDALDLDRIQASVFGNSMGIQLESFFISNERFELSAKGHVKGNVLSPDKLLADLNIQAKGDLQKALLLIPASSRPKVFPTGAFTAQTELKGDLLAPLQTLRLNGQINVRTIAFQNWKADSVQIEGKWDASPTGGDISLAKLSIASHEQARVGIAQPGGGGKIEVGPVRWSIGSSQPLQVPVRLERAHIHWLASVALEKIFPLDFRISGTIGTLFIPPQKNKPWEVRADVNASLDSFLLDNQKYKRAKPVSTVFRIPKIKLSGPVVINSSEIRPVNLVVSLPHSSVSASGKIDFKTGYDIYGIGTLNLEDLNQIAENDIRGQGTIAVHVHGPAKSVLVDVDVDMKDAFYLNLFLGKFKGRIVWDDDPQYLVLNRIQITQGSTKISLDGKLDLGPNTDTVDLNIGVSEGDIKELTSVFRNFTQKLSWFPHDLSGPVNGDIRVSGGIQFAKLKIKSKLNGVNWERWGERFKTVSLVGGYDQGKYEISDFKILKRSGRISGNISYDVDGALAWALKTDDLMLSDLDSISQLEVPIRGKLRIQSSGRGKEGAIESSSQFDLTDLSVRGGWMPPSQLNWKTSKGISSIQGTAVGGQGSLDVLYDANPKEMSYIRGELRQFDFSPVLLLLNPKAAQDRALYGILSGTMNLNFRSGQMDKADGTISISEYVLARSDMRLRLADPVSVKISGGNFDLDGLKLQGQSGDVIFALRSKNAQLEGSVRGTLENSIVEFFTPTVVQASGNSKIDLSIGGTAKEPSIFGKAIIEGAAVRVASLESPFENVTGVIQLRQEVISVQGLRADLGGGNVSVNGTLTLYPDRYPAIALKSVLSGSKIKVYPFQYAQVKGSIDVHGDRLPYLIEGYAVVDSALWKEKVFAQKKGTDGLKSVLYAPPASKQNESNTSKFKLNVQVEAEKGILIQNDLFRDVEAKGNLTLVNTLDSPKVLGRAEVITGKLIFKNHAFLIQSAAAQFDNPNVINPSFDMNAHTEVNGTKIQMYATGRLDKVKIEFTSNPSLQETEILSLLAVGMTSNDARRLNSGDRNVVQQGEVTSLLLHSLDFNRDFEDKTGFNVQLDESVNPQQGVSAFRSQSQTDTIVAPQITIRRKLGERLNLSAGSTVGVGTSRSNQISVDFAVTPGMSVLGIFNNYGTTGSADTQQNIQNSMGLDLKFQKRFK